MPLPAPLDDLPLPMQQRAVRLVLAPFLALPPDAALAAALAEADTWRERYPAVAEHLTRRAVRLWERFRGIIS